MIGSAAVLADAAVHRIAQANVPTPYSFDLQPPTTSKDAFVKWAVEHVYNKVVPFVPFTKLDGDAIKGTHSGGRRS
jgi:hypothetical protein